MISMRSRLPGEYAGELYIVKFTAHYLDETGSRQMNERVQMVLYHQPSDEQIEDIYHILKSRMIANGYKDIVLAYEEVQKL